MAALALTTMPTRPTNLSQFKQLFQSNGAGTMVAAARKEGLLGLQGTRWQQRALLTLAIAIAYLLVAKLSLALQLKPESIAVFWPASGLAAGALIALGPAARLPVGTAVLLATVVATAGAIILSVSDDMFLSLAPWPDLVVRLVRWRWT